MLANCSNFADACLCVLVSRARVRVCVCESVAVCWRVRKCGWVRMYVRACYRNMRPAAYGHQLHTGHACA